MVTMLRRACAWVAIVAFLGTFGLGAVTPGHLGPDDDAACGTPTAAHPRLQFESVKAPINTTHCPFCHWQRAVSGAHVSAVEVGVSSMEPAACLLPAIGLAALSN